MFSPSWPKKNSLIYTSASCLIHANCPSIARVPHLLPADLSLTAGIWALLDIVGSLLEQDIHQHFTKLSPSITQHTLHSITVKTTVHSVWLWASVDWNLLKAIVSVDLNRFWGRHFKHYPKFETIFWLGFEQFFGQCLTYYICKFLSLSYSSLQKPHLRYIRCFLRNILLALLGLGTLALALACATLEGCPGLGSTFGLGVANWNLALAGMAGLACGSRDVRTLVPFSRTWKEYIISLRTAPGFQPKVKGLLLIDGLLLPEMLAFQVQETSMSRVAKEPHER